MTVTGRLADAAAGARYVRFAVCKRDEVLLEACERLARLR
jgi:aspartate/methionine/tyrosine aminotransferase